MMNETPGAPSPPALLPVWYSKVLVLVAAISTIGTCLSGIGTMISVYPICIASGILQIIVGFFLTAVEMAFIFKRFPQLEKPIAIASALGDLQKGIAYILIGIFFMAMCIGFFNAVFLVGLVLVGLMYGYRWYKLRGVPQGGGYEPNQQGDRIVLQDDYREQVTNSAFQAAATPQGQAVIMNVGAQAVQQQWGAPGGVH